MQFQKKAWYAAAQSSEVGRTLLRRRILNIPVVMFRKEDGELAAMADRCPHRFAPLSAGRLDGDVISCAYHGLAFDADGKCVLNPHADVISPNMHVRTYPVVERYSLVWLWMDDSPCDPDAIPDLSYSVGENVKTVYNYLAAEYRYDILVDNLLDLSHADYLHLGSFSGGEPAHSDLKVREEGNSVVVVRSGYSATPAPYAATVAPLVDTVVEIRWHPGQVIAFDMSIKPAGDPAAAGQTSRFAHIATPESDNRTHYFMSVTRDFDIDNPELDAAIAERQVSVIRNEDGPMLEMIDEQMEGQDLLSLRPVVLPTDRGALQVRRVMKRLLSLEAAA